MPLMIPVEYANGDESFLGQCSDGHHTFDELYAHRFWLFLALCKALDNEAWRSKQHSDGSMYPGWFIVGVTLPSFGEITYHLPERLWEETWFLITYDRAPGWDGHTSQEVLRRLQLWTHDDIWE